MPNDTPKALPTVERAPVVAYGPVIGSFLDRDIHAWVQLDDGIYNYEGVAPGPRPGVVDPRLVPAGRVLLKPGLCYSPADATAH